MPSSFLRYCHCFRLLKSHSPLPVPAEKAPTRWFSSTCELAPSTTVCHTNTPTTSSSASLSAESFNAMKPLTAATTEKEPLLSPSKRKAERKQERREYHISKENKLQKKVSALLRWANKPSLFQRLTNICRRIELQKVEDAQRRYTGCSNEIHLFRKKNNHSSIDAELLQVQERKMDPEYPLRLPWSLEDLMLRPDQVAAAIVALATAATEPVAHSDVGQDTGKMIETNSHQGLFHAHDSPQNPSSQTVPALRPYSLIHESAEGEIDPDPAATHCSFLSLRSVCSSSDSSLPPCCWPCVENEMIYHNRAVRNIKQKQRNPTGNPQLLQRLYESVMSVSPRHQWAASILPRKKSHERDHALQEVSLVEHANLLLQCPSSSSLASFLKLFSPSSSACLSRGRVNCVVDVGGGNGILAFLAANRLSSPHACVVDPWHPQWTVEKAYYSSAASPNSSTSTVSSSKHSSDLFPYLFRRIEKFSGSLSWREDIIHSPSESLLMSKHLCGSASDELLLNLLDRQQVKPQYLCLSTCCHHKVNPSTYCNPELFQSKLGIQLLKGESSGDDRHSSSSLIDPISGKVIVPGVQRKRCAKHSTSQHHENRVTGLDPCDRNCSHHSSDEANDHSEEFLLLGRKTCWLAPERPRWMQVIGAALESVFTYGRLDYLRRHGYDAVVVDFISPLVSPRNKLILAVYRGGHRPSL